jgi:putative redox protein
VAGTIQVSARLRDKFTVESEIRWKTVYIDQPGEAGGDDAGPTPLEMVLLSLAGCVGHIARIVANQRKIALRSLQADVQGEIDKDFLLGKTREGRAGFTSIAVRVSMDADLTPAEKEEFLREVERRCPVSDNLVAATDVAISLGD